MPKGTLLSCPGPAVLTAFPVWEMLSLKCLGLNGLAHACSGVKYIQFGHLGVISNYCNLAFLPFCCWVQEG